MNTKTLAIVLALSSSAAFAGMKASSPVEIVSSYSYSYAAGSLGTARNSGDKTQSIGCTIYAWNLSAPPTVYCSATDATGRVFSCTTSGNVSLAQVVGSITATSKLYFQVQNDDPTHCSKISVMNYSQYAEPPQL
jgi:hypothetical protein